MREAELISQVPLPQDRPGARGWAGPLHIWCCKARGPSLVLSFPKPF